MLTAGPRPGAPGDWPASVVLVVEDHELLATTLCLALRDQGFTAHRAALDSVAAIMAEAATLTPGVAVLDLHLGRDQHGDWINPADVAGQLSQRGWAVLVVTGSRDDESIAAALAAGAVGWLQKTAMFAALLDRIRAAAAGEPVMTDTERHDWLRRHDRMRNSRRTLTTRFDRLSTREREVLDLLARGHRAAEIATHFTVSLTTVRTQIRAILAKLEITSQLEAVALLEQYRTGPHPGLL